VDLLLSDLFFTYSKDPARLRHEAIEKIKHEHIKTIFIDEVQRIPILLNEVQFLMQNFDCQFILTGSSARKLKRGGANLLGGRAVERHLFPFVHEEIKDQFQLERVLLLGTLPSLTEQSTQEKIDILSAYAHTYLKEEIQNEGIVRNLGGFSRFLDMAASQFGELLSFSNIARECQLPTRTIQSYYEILEDTLIGFRLEPWKRSIRKRLSAHPKFYFFDNGITNAVNKQLTGTLDAQLAGRLFEQWVILETYRAIHYHRSEANLFYWRTNHGAEVDLLIEKHGKLVGAFEIKHTPNVAGVHLSGIRAFRQECPKTPCFVVSTAPNAYEIDKVTILPWKNFLELLKEMI
jgi:predicted AAA+ superfamily ATPase